MQSLINVCGRKKWFSLTLHHSTLFLPQDNDIDNLNLKDSKDNSLKGQQLEHLPQRHPCNNINNSSDNQHHHHHHNISDNNDNIINCNNHKDKNYDSLKQQQQQR